MSIDTAKHMAKGNGAKKSANIQPLGDKVLVKVENTKTEKTTASGIILPGSVSDDRGAKQGVVVAIGPGRYEDGKVVPVKVKVGDTVLFQWGDEIKIGEETYHIVGESSILAIIN